ncbi:MAG: hypothetical protein M9916_01815 [Crocinitomicaceae bacterium]|nr:hypothetical protein [Crocinitomicaceae bacterium]
MKKTILVFLAVAGLMMYGCNNHEASHDETNHEEHADHDHGHDHDEAIELNNGEKWEINAEMRPYIENAEKLLNQYLKEKGTDYKKLATDLSNENTSLIKSCTMDGKSHDELHKWLHPHLELVDALENAASDSEASEIVTHLEHSFLTFHEYFQ